MRNYDPTSKVRDELNTMSQCQVAHDDRCRYQYSQISHYLYHFADLIYIESSYSSQYPLAHTLTELCQTGCCSKKAYWIARTRHDLVNSKLLNCRQTGAMSHDKSSLVSCRSSGQRLYYSRSNAVASDVPAAASRQLPTSNMLLLYITLIKRP